MSKHQHTPASAAVGIEHAIRMLEGRWKLVILFHLFGGRKLRFSDLERAIPAISQKMLIQQLRQLERDGIVARIVHAQVPPKVEYHLTSWGQSLSGARRAPHVGGEAALSPAVAKCKATRLLAADLRRPGTSIPATRSSSFQEGRSILFVHVSRWTALTMSSANWGTTFRKRPVSVGIICTIASAMS